MRIFSRALFVLLLGGSGVLHLTSPAGYEEIVPPQLGNPSPWVWLSGILEIALAGLLVPSRTRRVAAMGCVALLVAVFPANVFAALQGGYATFPPPFDSPAVAWARLPLQVLLVWWAWSLRRRSIHGE